MARQNKPETAVPEEAVTPTEGNVAPAEAEMTPVNPWTDTVKVKLFMDNGNYKDDVYVAVNGRRFQIKRGVEVEVPRCVAEVLENSAKQDMYVANLVEQLEADYDAASKKN